MQRVLSKPLQLSQEMPTFTHKRGYHTILARAELSHTFRYHPCATAPSRR